MIYSVEAWAMGKHQATNLDKATHPAGVVTPTPLPDPIAQSRPVRTYRAWIEETDPPREPMTTGEKVAFVFVCIASGLISVWGVLLLASKMPGY